MSRKLKVENIECALLTNGYKSRSSVCALNNPNCMHNIEGSCAWVEIGDNETFISTRKVSNNKFLSEAKRSSLNIKLLVLVDNYYEHLRTKFNVYPTERAGIELDFPFDYPGHIWSDQLLELAVDSDILEPYCDTLPEKSAEMLLNSVYELELEFE